MKYTKEVQCPYCHGYGSFTEVILDDGTGPSYNCGFCKGKGTMKKNKLYYQCLGWLSAEKRHKKKIGNKLAEYFS